MEKRVGIKILTMILIKGLSSARENILDFYEYSSCDTEKQREELYIKKLKISS